MTTPADLVAVRNGMANQYRQLLAEVKADPNGASPALLGKTMVAAVCANDQVNAVRIAQRLVPNVPSFAPLRLSPLATLAEYCQARALRYEQVLAPTRVEIAASLTSPALSYDTEPAVFASVPRAQYIPGWDFVIGEDDTVVRDSGYMPLDLATKSFQTFHIRGIDSLVHYSPDEERFVDEEVLFLSTPVNNVGHWMIDFLPRLKGLAVLGRKVKLAVPSDIPARYLELLRAFDISDSDLIACAPQVRHRFRMCHVYRPGRAEPPNPVHLGFVRETLTGRKTLSPRAGKRVFLARTRIGTRRIANQPEFQAFLERHDFTAADPADLSLAEQETLLGDAQLILGPYGSNLFGMYLAPSACTVITLISAVQKDLVFAATAGLLGMRHDYVVCENAPEAGLQLQKKDRDIIVDCEALGRRLADLGVA